MDCTLVDSEIIPFHFGTMDTARALRIEHHLMICSACLKQFFDTKRAIALSDQNQDLPQQTTAQSLRSEYRSLWKRPSSMQKQGLPRLEFSIPLLTAVAVATALLCFGFWLRRPTSSDLEPPPTAMTSPSESIDSASPIARNLNTL